MKLLDEVNWRFGLDMDDSQMHLIHLAGPRKATEILNQCLKAIWKWMKTNKVKLNPNWT